MPVSLFLILAVLLVFVTPCELALADNELTPGTTSNGATKSNESASTRSDGALKYTDATGTTLEELVSKALTAYGSKEALAQVITGSCFYGRRKTESTGNAAFTYRHVRKGIKWRIDIEESIGNDAKGGAINSSGSERKTDSPTSAATDGDAGNSKSIATAFDGSRGWQSTGKEVVDLPPDKLAFLNEEEIRQPWLLAYWNDADWKFDLHGRTHYKQVPVFALDVSYKDRRPTTLYLDQNNYLVVAASYNVELPESESAGRGPAKDATVTVDYGEYRPVAGTLLPHRITRTINGNQVSEINLNTITIGSSAQIEESVFSKPGTGTAWHLPRSVVVPFDYSQRELLIKCRLNGGSDDLDFLLDTGASETIIDRRVAAEHFLAKQGQFDIAAIAGYVSAQSSIIKRLEIGNMILNDVQARVLDLSRQSRSLGKPIAGIIGTNIISKFVVTVDYSKPAIIFNDIDSYVRPAKASYVPFVQKQAPFVKVVLNGRDEQVLLVDTGAAFNHLPTLVAQRYLPDEPTSLRHTTEGTGLDGRPLQLGKVVVNSVAIGSLSINKVTFTYPWRADVTVSSASKPAAPSVTSRGGFFQDSHLGILGNPFWENFITTIDYKYQRLVLQANPIVRVRNEIDQLLAVGDNQLAQHRDYRVAELSYQKAVMLADGAGDARCQAMLLGRLGNLRRIMAKDLNRPEHAKAAYTYFTRAAELAVKAHVPDVEGRILADWSLLYSDNGQSVEAKQTMDRSLMLAPQDPNVNVDCAVHLYRQHLYPEMQKYIEKALFLEPSNWQALWYQVKLSETFMDTPRVVATLKEILRFYPWSKVAADKLRSMGITAPSTQSPGTVSPRTPMVQPRTPLTPLRHTPAAQ